MMHTRSCIVTYSLFSCVSSRNTSAEIMRWRWNYLLALMSFRTCFYSFMSLNVINFSTQNESNEIKISSDIWVYLMTSFLQLLLPSHHWLSGATAVRTLLKPPGFLPSDTWSPTSSLCHPPSLQSGTLPYLQTQLSGFLAAWLLEKLIKCWSRRRVEN